MCSAGSRLGSCARWRRGAGRAHGRWGASAAPGRPQGRLSQGPARGARHIRRAGGVVGGIVGQGGVGALGAEEEAAELHLGRRPSWRPRRHTRRRRSAPRGETASRRDRCDSGTASPARSRDAGPPPAAAAWSPRGSLPAPPVRRGCPPASGSRPGAGPRRGAGPGLPAAAPQSGASSEVTTSTSPGTMAIRSTGRAARAVFGAANRRRTTASSPPAIASSDRKARTRGAASAKGRAPGSRSLSPRAQRDTVASETPGIPASPRPQKPRPAGQTQRSLGQHGAGVGVAGDAVGKRHDLLLPGSSTGAGSFDERGEAAGGRILRAGVAFARERPAPCLRDARV